MPTLRTLAPLCFALAAGLAVAETKKETPSSIKPVADKPAAAASADKGRDWSKIDTNKDGLISPEEMEKYLAANPGPLRK